MDKTARLKLPLLAAGQAQKEVTHNEALLLLDLLVATVGNAPSNDPPNGPTEGAVLICGKAPQGEWIGQANSLAVYTAGGWRFAPPVEGQKIIDEASGQEWQFRGGDWVCGAVLASKIVINGRKVVGPQGAAISGPTSGSVIDQEARSAIAAILGTLRTHGLIAS